MVTTPSHDADMSVLTCRACCTTSSAVRTLAIVECCLVHLGIDLFASLFFVLLTMPQIEHVSDFGANNSHTSLTPTITCFSEFQHTHLPGFSMKPFISGRELLRLRAFFQRYGRREWTQTQVGWRVVLSSTQQFSNQAPPSQTEISPYFPEI